MKEEFRLPFSVKLPLMLLTLALLLIVLREATFICIPVLFAIFLSILLLPLVKFMEYRLRMGRLLPPIIAVLIALAAIGAFIYFFALQLAAFSEDFPTLRTHIMDLSGELQQWISNRLQISFTQQAEYINRSLTGILSSAGRSASSVLISLSGMTLLTILVFLFSYFILYYRRLLTRFLFSLFNQQTQPRVREVVQETRHLIYRYISGLLIEMLLMGVFNTALFLLVDIKYAILLGVTAALLNVIPYLGIYTALILTMVVTFANDPGTAALNAGLGLFILHLLDANIMFPRIIGSRMNMNPFITILAVIAGQYVWGIPGMFLSIPIVGVIKLICERVDGLHPWSILIGNEEKQS